MKLEDKLVGELKYSVVEDILNRYVEFLRQSDPEKIKNSEWQRFATALRRSGAEETIPTVFRQVLVDALANVLGVLDGSSNLATMRGDFRVFYDGTLLDKSLADALWESEGG